VRGDTLLKDTISYPTLLYNRL